MAANGLGIILFQYAEWLLGQGVLPEYDSPVYPGGGAFRVLAGKEASFLARSHVLLRTCPAVIARNRR